MPGFDLMLLTWHYNNSFVKFYCQDMSEYRQEGHFVSKYVIIMS